MRRNAWQGLGAQRTSAALSDYYSDLPSLPRPREDTGFYITPINDPVLFSCPSVVNVQKPLVSLICSPRQQLTSPLRSPPPAPPPQTNSHCDSNGDPLHVACLLTTPLPHQPPSPSPSGIRGLQREEPKRKRGKSTRPQGASQTPEEGLRGN